jgi:nicotinamidase-related amidase
MIRLPKDTALILIDLQNAIDDPKWGRRGNPQAEDNAARLLAAWRAGRHKIIHIRHDSTLATSPYRPGQPGNEFKSAVAPLAGEAVVAKQATSAFINTTLEADLEAGGHTTLVVCGVLTQNSVEATVRHGGNLGFRIVVAEDACAATDVVDLLGRVWMAEDVHALSLANLNGEYADISDTATLVTAISRWR